MYKYHKHKHTVKLNCPLHPPTPAAQQFSVSGKEFAVSTLAPTARLERRSSEFKKQTGSGTTTTSIIRVSPSASTNTSGYQPYAAPSNTTT